MMGYIAILAKLTIYTICIGSIQQRCCSVAVTIITHDLY